MNNVIALSSQDKKKIWIRDDKDRFLVLHAPTGMWYVRAKKKGKRPLFKATGQKTKLKAKTKAMLMLAEWMGTRPPIDSECILFRDFAEEFLVHLEKTKLRVRTKENARLYIRQLIDELGHEDIRNINEGFFDEWLPDFRQRVKRSTFADYAKYLSKTMRHAHRKGLIHRLPEFKNPDAPKKAGRIYSREEVSDMLDHSHVTQELQIRLCLQGFMRLREMLHLAKDRVNLQTGLIRLGADDVKTGSRTGEGREFYVNAEILSLLRLQNRAHPKSRFLFPSPMDNNKPQWSIKTSWATLKRRAGIEGRARWHDLRHTALTWALIEKKMNPLLVSKYAGVSVRTIEKVYLKVKPEHTKEIASCIEI